jgi:hypothetical protein
LPELNSWPIPRQIRVRIWGFNLLQVHGLGVLFIVRLPGLGLANFPVEGPAVEGPVLEDAAVQRSGADVFAVCRVAIVGLFWNLGTSSVQSERDAHSMSTGPLNEGGETYSCPVRRRKDSGRLLNRFRLRVLGSFLGLG